MRALPVMFPVTRCACRRPAARRRCIAALATGLVAAGLAGCGGGSDGAAAAPPPPGATATCGLDPFASQALQRLNEARAQGAVCGTTVRAPAPPLAWNARLADAAAGHAAYMAASGRFSHSGPDGSGVGARVEAAGYAWSAVAENIAAGYPSVTAVISGWMASAGHCNNALDARMQEAGLACARATDGTPYWVLVLARPR